VIIPEYEQMADALLYIIYINGKKQSFSLAPKQIYEPMADLFDLTYAERNEPRPDGYSGSHWQNRVQWTRQKLINEGYLDGGIRGIWRLTEQGINRASKLKNNFQR